MSYDPLTDLGEAVDELKDANNENLVNLFKQMMADVVPELKKIRMHLECLTGEIIDEEEIDDDEI